MEVSRFVFDQNYLLEKDKFESKILLACTGPLINIKKAIAKIKEEIIEMELEIGVLKHSLDQDIIKQNALYAELDPVPDFEI